MTRDELTDFFKYCQARGDKVYYSYGEFDKLAKKTDVLEKMLAETISALEKGITLDQLLKKNKTVRTWYDADIQSRAAQEAAAIKNAARQAKFAEKQRLENEARAAVMAKMTPEEIEAFGLNKKGAKK
jgi:hypothetical protein